MMQLTALQDDEKTSTVVSIEANLVNTYSNSDPSSSSFIATENVRNHCQPSPFRCTYRDLPRAFQVWRCAVGECCTVNFFSTKRWLSDLYVTAPLETSHADSKRSSGAVDDCYKAGAHMHLVQYDDCLGARWMK